jgi:capsular polysaccharide transport system ATP-binding protein
MLMFDRVTDYSSIDFKQSLILDNSSLAVPEGRYALLVDRFDVRRIAVNLLCGARQPKHGRIYGTGHTSWPIGRMSLFRHSLTGRDVLALICRIHSLPFEETEEFVAGMVGYPELSEERIIKWPAQHRSDFSFALGLLPAFQSYVFDRQLPLANQPFGALWWQIFEKRAAGRLVIISSINRVQLLSVCNRALIFAEREIFIDDDLERAVTRYPPENAVRPGASDEDSPEDEF